MSAAFTHIGGGVRLQADGVELEMLRAIPELMATIGEVGSDPAADRLFPGVYDDPDDDREFRRLSEGEIGAGRTLDAKTVRGIVDALGDGGTVDLGLEQGEALMRAVGTARVTIAARHGMFELDDLPMRPQSRHEVVVAMLGLLQEDLVDAMTAGLPS